MKFPQLAGNLAFSETSSQLTPPSSGESCASLKTTSTFWCRVPPRFKAYLGGRPSRRGAAPAQRSATGCFRRSLSRGSPRRSERARLLRRRRIRLVRLDLARLRRFDPPFWAARRRHRHGPKHRRDERSTVFERPYRHISAMTLSTAIRPCRERQRANESATSNAPATGCQRPVAAGQGSNRLVKLLPASREKLVEKGAIETRASLPPGASSSESKPRPLPRRPRNVAQPAEPGRGRHWEALAVPAPSSA